MIFSLFHYGHKRDSVCCKLVVQVNKKSYLQIDPEFEEDFAEGELRNDMISGESSTWTKPNEEASDSTVHSGNYTVSPWELSLRLHNVIQSRLEARIKKLEIALQNNDSKLQLVDTEYSCSWLELGNGELQFTSNESSPNTLDMDFSKEAIDGIY